MYIFDVFPFSINFACGKKPEQQPNWIFYIHNIYNTCFHNWNSEKVDANEFVQQNLKRKLELLKNNIYLDIINNFRNEYSIHLSYLRDCVHTSNSFSSKTLNWVHVQFIHCITWFLNNFPLSHFFFSQSELIWFECIHLAHSYMLAVWINDIEISNGKNGKQHFAIVNRVERNWILKNVSGKQATRFSA